MYTAHLIAFVSVVQLADGFDSDVPEDTPARIQFYFCFGMWDDLCCHLYNIHGVSDGLCTRGL